MLRPKAWVVEWLAKANATRPRYQQLDPRHVVEILQDEHPECSLREAFASVYIDGDKIFPESHDDWKSYARFLRDHTDFSVPLIASLVQGWFGAQNLSTVFRELSPEHKAKQAEYQRAYCKRHPERRAETQRKYAAKVRRRRQKDT